MYLRRTGFVADQAIAAAARVAFEQTRTAVFSQFLEPEMAREFVKFAEVTQMSTKDHVTRDRTITFGNDLSAERTSAVRHGMQLILNNRGLFRALEQITGCQQITGFQGRLYRMMPGSTHHLGWHDDRKGNGRLLGLSVNLSRDGYCGGEFRLRRKDTHEILSEIVHEVAGAAHIFAIEQAVEHSVDCVSGSEPRTAFAGWFVNEADATTVITDLYTGRD